MSATKNQDFRKAMPVTETQLYYVTLAHLKLGFNLASDRRAQKLSKMQVWVCMHARNPISGETCPVMLLYHWPRCPCYIPRTQSFHFVFYFIIELEADSVPCTYSAVIPPLIYSPNADPKIKTSRQAPKQQQKHWPKRTLENIHKKEPH